MIYKKYGKVFRELRNQKNIPISHFEKIGISKATLAKFERGESMMRFDRVLLALQELGISLGEYDAFINNFIVNDKNELIEQIMNADIIGDKDALSNLSIKAKQLGFSSLNFASKCAIGNISEYEKEQILDRLFSINIWGFEELSLLYHSLSNLSAREIHLLVNSFLIDKHPILDSSEHRNIFLQIAYRAVILFSSRGYFESSEYILNCIDNYDLEHTMFNQNLRTLAHGYWLIRFRDKTKGKIEVQKALDCFSNMNCSRFAKYYQKMFENF